MKICRFHYALITTKYQEEFLIKITEFMTKIIYIALSDLFYGIKKLAAGKPADQFLYLCVFFIT